MPSPDAPLPRRVLIAEDDDSLRRLLEMRLSAGGYELRSAGDGVRALELMEDWTPHVVICDVMMPHLSGLSVVREMRDRPETRSVPVVLLTARCFDEDIQQVINLGGVTYMPKPFDFTRLGDAINALLHTSKPPAEGT
ncbi:MAG: response regulator [Candidatus Dormibacteraeota bacterium]|nr:response regulator [Candidatus Dormibacteraeota bacterium]